MKYRIVKKHRISSKGDAEPYFVIECLKESTGLFGERWIEPESEYFLDDFEYDTLEEAKKAYKRLIAVPDDEVIDI